MNYLMVTTTLELPGYKTVKTLGLVRGLTVRSRSVIGNLGAGLQSIFGGNITIYETLCEEAREQALDLMMKHAEELGANAVLTTRYDTTDIMQGITEVLCYGTAAVVEKE